MRRAHLSLALMALTMLVSVGALLALPTGSANGAAVPTEPNFTDSPVTNGLASPTDMEFAPDGKVFVLEQAGRVRFVHSDGTPRSFLNISTKVDASGERGLLGIAFDPNFATNRYVYLHYTRKATSTAPVHNRVVRVRANAGNSAAVSGSEKLVFRLDNLQAGNHNGGDIHFGPDGKLYIATGENAVPNNAQSLNNLKGKILRINKSGAIPTDNPFYNQATGNNRAIWALGLRNPFKFAIQPGTTGTIFINDVGQDAWEEIDKAVPGANYGWGFPTSPPYYEGIIASPDPSLRNYNNPVFAYGHDGDIETTGCSITGGVFYNPATLQYPEEYKGDYFFADFCSGWVRSLDSTGLVRSFAKEIVRPVDLEVSKEGELYYLSRGTSSTPGSVGKIRYSGGTA